MEKTEYEIYEKRVKAFFEEEGINNLSQIPDKETGEYPEEHFSWQKCDCCAGLAGGRLEVNGYNPKTEEVQGPYEVCMSCLYYSEHGQLDDMTMMEIEETEV